MPVYGLGAARSEQAAGHVRLGVPNNLSAESDVGYRALASIVWAASGYARLR